MPRIRTVPPQEATGELADAYESLEQFGLPVVPTVFQLSSIRPDLADVFVRLYRALFGPGELSPSAKEAIATYVSALNRCPYCVDAHTTLMQVHGASAEQIQAARAGDLSAFTDDSEIGAFLPLAEKVTRHAYKVTDEDIESLRAIGWSDEKILEATYVVAAFNLINRLADTFGIADAEFQDDLMRAMGTAGDDGNAPAASRAGR